MYIYITQKLAKKPLLYIYISSKHHLPPIDKIYSDERRSKVFAAK
jgi:hypothetical protein